MTYEQIILKLSAICAHAEHCKDDMRRKMLRWDIDEETQQRVLDYLVKERYIDEERYTRYFINDKIKYNKWGRKKVEQALYLKHIPQDISRPLLDEIDDASYLDILLPLLKTKRKSTKGNSDYEIRMKLIRFAMGRGFSYEQSQNALSQIGLDEE